jgi:hypothetical protein
MSFGEYAQELIATANYITQTGKGILASDESTGTFSLELPSTSRHIYYVYICR